MYEIKPFDGLGPLSFGMKIDQVESILGQPDDIETIVSGDLEIQPTEIHHYDGLGISLEYEWEDDLELVNISVSQGNYTLNGVALLGKKFQNFMDALGEMGLTIFDFQNLEGFIPDEEETVYSYETGIKWWIEDGIIVEMQFSCYEEEIP